MQISHDLNTLAHWVRVYLFGPPLEAMDLTSMRLELDGFSDDLADEIGLYDVLTIRGVASGEVSSKLDYAGRAEEEVAAPVTPVLIPKGASTSPSLTCAAASSTTLESDMQFTSSSMNPYHGC